MLTMMPMMTMIIKMVLIVMMVLIIALTLRQTLAGGDHDNIGSNDNHEDY